MLSGSFTFILMTDSHHTPIIKFQSVPLVFPIQPDNAIVGRLKAIDIDDAPYNSTYYYILPSCKPYFLL